MAVYRKLQSKVEALKIVKKQMEHYRTERDQFKLMAETLQLRYSAMKKSLNETNYLDYFVPGESSNGIATLVNETREKNMALTTQVEAYKQRVEELQGDIKVLRTKAEKGRKRESSTGSSIASGDCTFCKNEKSELIAQLESLKKKVSALQSFSNQKH